MAPEVFAGGTVSAASDIFSLAATLWTLLVGAPPRYGDAMKIEKVAPDARPGAARVRSPAAWRCCPRCASRPRSAFAEAIGVPISEPGGESLAQSLGARAGPPPRDRGDRAHRRRHVRGRRRVDRAHRPATGELVYEAAWGAGRVGGRRHATAAGRRPLRRRRGERRGASRCRSAATTRASQRRSPRRPATCRTRCSSRRSCARARPIGALSLLDRRDGEPYRHEDLARAALFADLAVVALDLDTFPLSTTGGRTLPLD